MVNRNNKFDKINIYSLCFYVYANIYSKLVEDMTFLGHETFHSTGSNPHLIDEIVQHIAVE